MNKNNEIIARSKINSTESKMSKTIPDREVSKKDYILI